MSKIVCDVCGSTYSENEVQCPICGTTKSEAAKPAVEAIGEDVNTNNGKFSKNNSRKNGVGATAKKSGENKSANGNEEGAPSNMAMIIIVGVLLMAIIAVCIFIAVRIFDQPDMPATNPSTTESTAPTILEIPCTGIELIGNADKTLNFAALTDSAQLNVKALPENTTETVTYTYTSSDPSIVIVDAYGLVTPVASGNATITVAYGSYSIVVNVTCDIPAPITELTLRYTDVTLSPANGLSLNLYNGELDPSLITWTSADESVAIVENGVVTAVGNNKYGVKITATYGDLSATCLVRVTGMEERAFLLTTGYQSGTEISVTLTMGSDESFLLKLINKETQEVVKDVVWTFSPEGPKYCTKAAEEDGLRVTATADTTTAQGGYVYVQAEYEGEVYRCKIIIKPAQTQE